MIEKKERSAVVRWWFEVADDKGKKEKKGERYTLPVADTHKREKMPRGEDDGGGEGGRGRQLYSFPPKIPP